MANLLELEDVSLVLPRGSLSLLENISFRVEKGDRLGIVGSSGAGKTTLIRLLNRLDDPTSGLIKFEDKPLTQIPVIQLRQRVVLVPQEPKLLGMTVEDTLTYPLRLQHLSKGEIQQRLDHWTSRLSIPSQWFERNELQLSVGQRQLVAITRGLMMHPQILLLDEPTSALDIGKGNHLIEVLIEVSDTTQTAIIMINHQLELVRQFAQRVLYLSQGKIVQLTIASQVNWEHLQEQLKQAPNQTALFDDL
ncbi:ABC transporter related [Gloeothece citriformis PCC 7424]|uniref:ABC transporter related n=1 Tax=Gloeothece citriformis (strain PCC 7424) TaxID=65393 RepID=B7K8Z4_GLOC7|nr:ATP-binding cassette domain-containing protein [Gloeothece citriformis]ACK72763.1 ABC transporter related [Gloeothece citriformis PCC 7424]